MFLALLLSLSRASACEPADLDCDGRVTSAEKAAYEHGCTKTDDDGRSLRPLVDHVQRDDAADGKPKDVRRRPREDRRGPGRARGRGHGAGKGKDVRGPEGGR